MVDRIARELVALAPLIVELEAVATWVRALPVWMGVQKLFVELHSSQCLFGRSQRVQLPPGAWNPC